MNEENYPAESGWSSPGMMEPLFPPPAPLEPEPALPMGSLSDEPAEAAPVRARRKAKKAGKKKAVKRKPKGKKKARKARKAKARKPAKKGKRRR